MKIELWQHETDDLWTVVIGDRVATDLSEVEALGVVADVLFGAGAKSQAWLKVYPAGTWQKRTA